MHPIIENYLQQHNAKERKALDKKKKALLDRLNLYEKEYCTDNQLREQYPYAEWDDALCDEKRFRKIYPEFTDEEYEMVKATLAPPEPEKNGVSVALKVLAIVQFVAGFILSIAFSESSVMVGVWLGSGFVSGLTTLALGEIVRLLHEINQKK